MRSFLLYAFSWWGILLRIVAIVHFIRRRPDFYWIWVILIHPIGALVYIVTEVIPDAGLLRVLESRTSACRLPSAAEAVRFEKLLQGDAKTPLVEKKLLARGGDTVIELAWYGTPDDPVWAEQAVAELERAVRLAGQHGLPHVLREAREARQQLG